MNTFRTDVSVLPSPHKIELKTAILTAGSCFSDAIGSRLRLNKFPVLVNPTGVIYNPASIHQALLFGIANKGLPEESFLVNNGIHSNYCFHSELSALDRSDLNRRLADMLETMHNFLSEASWIMITYGTAWVYERKDTGAIVANCHKIPAQQFTKRLMSEDEIMRSFETFYSALKQFYPTARIILTLSPVRHVKDTLELNSVSKAVLRTSCYKMSTTFRDVEYFPAYEIMMDDLRDYRFYKSDMLHPSEDAEHYIWEKFAGRYFGPETASFLKEWESMLASISHKAFHPATPAHQQFLRSLLKKLESLEAVVNVEWEKEIVRKQLL
jgi:hypothetical protein